MDSTEQAAQLAEYADLLKLSLAGNLKEYELETADGERKIGRQVSLALNMGGESLLKQ